MTQMTKREELARIIDPEAWDNGAWERVQLSVERELRPKAKALARKKADAILDALREPTRSMLYGGAAAVENTQDETMGSLGGEPYWDFQKAALNCWNAMLATAWAEPGA